MILTLDVENTTTTRDGKLHLDPFEKDNSLTQVGTLDQSGNEHIFTFDHSEKQGTPFDHQCVQSMLDKTTVLVAHNAVHDSAVAMGVRLYLYW